MAGIVNGIWKRGLGIGALAFGLAAGSQFMNAAGLTSQLLNTGVDFPGLPGVTASTGNLFWQSVIVALPVAVATGLAALLRRAVACVVYLGMWFWSLSRLGALFLPEGQSGGAIWMLWHPGLTPAIAFVGAVVIYVLMDPERR